MKIYLKTNELNTWIAKYFPNKDLITVEDLISCIEDLDSELDHLREELQDVIQDRDDNFKRISVKEQVNEWWNNNNFNNLFNSNSFSNNK